MPKKRKWLPFMVLIGIILVRGFAGSINTISSQFLVPVSEELGIGIGTLSLYFSIMSIVQVLWISFAGKLLNKYDVRMVALGAICLQALSFMALGFMNQVIGWYLLSVPQAMGSAVLVSLLGPILINRWFPRSTGTVLGIQSAFVGLFGVVIQPVTASLISEKGWRNAYISIGFVVFTAVVLAIVFFIRSRPYDIVNGQTGKEEVMKEQGIVQISEKTAIRSISFVALLVFMIALTGVAVFVQHIPTYGTLLGYSVLQIGTALSAASVGSALGSLFIGFAGDRIGGLRTCYMIIGLWLLAIIGFGFSAQNYLIFIGATFLNGLAAPSVMVLSPILTLIFYGNKDYEKIYAKVSMGAPLASIFMIPVYGFIYDLTKSYTIVLFILATLLLIAGGSIYLGWKNRCTLEGCPVFWEKRK